MCHKKEPAKHLPTCLKVKVEDREYTVSTDPAEWSAVERYKSFRKRSHSVSGLPPGTQACAHPGQFQRLKLGPKSQVVLSCPQQSLETFPILSGDKQWPPTFLYISTLNITICLTLGEPGVGCFLFMCRKEE